MSTKTTTSIESYLQSNPGEDKTIMQGVVFFGQQKVEEIAGLAVEQEKKIDFFYANDDDLKSDILSWRLIPRTAS